MLLRNVAFILGTVAICSYGCEHEKIFGCASGLRKELASTRFVVNVRQLNTYCDNMVSAHQCILDESQSCQADVKATYAQAVKAEQLVIRDLCRPGPFQDEYLREASCVSSIYSERNGGPCRKPYARLLLAAFEVSAQHSGGGSGNSSKAKNATLKANTSSPASDSAVLLHNMCCSYYAVYECTQAHAGRCGGRSLNKNPLRQIYKGLDHNCRPFKTLCSHQPWQNSSSRPATGTGGSTLRRGGITGVVGGAKSGQRRTWPPSAPTDAMASVALAIVMTLVSLLITLHDLVT